MKEAEDDWWSFARERQNIWYRREVLKVEQPWTDDPVLLRYHICNIQRELDYGTQVLQEQVIPLAQSAEEAVWNVLAYRFINNADTWMVHLGPLRLGESDAWINRVRALRDVPQGHSRRAETTTVFTRAWMVPPLAHLPGDIYDRYAGVIRDWKSHLSFIINACASGDLATVHHAIVELPGYGNFTGFQAALDMCYVFKSMVGADDSWVFTLVKKGGAGGHNVAKNPAGSGYGAKLIDQDAEPIDTMRELRDRQPDWWASIAWPGKPDLVLADIEHGLCEWTKYLRLRAGVNTRSRIFKARPSRVEEEVTREPNLSVRGRDPVAAPRS